jgi:hypothetical protein
MEQITAEYALTPAESEILRLAGQLLDRVHQAREAVARDGAFFKSARGLLTAHPGVKVEKDASLAFASLIKQLALDDLNADDLLAAHKRRR